MGERESAKVRELKEAAHALYVRGRFAQCAETYERLLRLAPKDPNLHVRHAEACRRAGNRQAAIASYREASQLLLCLGCESRARGALKAALELDPRDAMLMSDLARLGYSVVPSTALEDERLYSIVPGVLEHADGMEAPLPPPPPPSFVLNAAQETPRPLPSAPTIAPVSMDSLRRASPTMVPVPPGSRGAVPPPLPRRPSATVPPVLHAAAPGAATQRTGAPSMHAHPGAPVVPAAHGRPTQGAAVHAFPPRIPAVPPVPAPRAPTLPGVSAPGGMPAQRRNEAQASSLTMPPLPVMPYRPELRRLAPNVVALRVSPQARWVIIRSDSPLDVSRAEVLPEAPAAPGAPGAAHH